LANPAITENAEQRLNALSVKLFAGLNARAVVSDGDPAVCITDLARSRHVDLIMTLWATPDSASWFRHLERRPCVDWKGCLAAFCRTVPFAREFDHPYYALSRVECLKWLRGFFKPYD